LGGNNSGVECNLAKVEVAGSNPVSRSIVKTRLSFPEPFFFGTIFGCQEGEESSFKMIAEKVLL
jgi:hypothetical protein